jgi:L-histidine N-alpha-methyltransferase
VPAKLASRLRVVGNGQHDERSDFVRDIRAGLTATPKHLPCRHIYDANGSRLFEMICELPEYYLTRAEREILETQADAIAADLVDVDALVELGSGSSTKTRTLLAALLERKGRLHYVPMDISHEILVHSALEMLEQFPGLEITAIAAEYLAGLQHVHDRIGGRKCIAWLGSSIGNYAREDARNMLIAIRRTLDPGDMILVGIDLRKEAEVLEKAYDDSAGVTADFNTNILRRVNRDLGGDFDLGQFEYEARYDDGVGAVLMSQVSQANQTVRVAQLDLEIELAAGERILTERSFKYSHAEIEQLATDCGMSLTDQWHDSAERITLNVLTV